MTPPSFLEAPVITPELEEVLEVAPEMTPPEEVGLLPPKTPLLEPITCSSFFSCELKMSFLGPPVITPPWVGRAPGRPG